MRRTPETLVARMMKVFGLASEASAASAPAPAPLPQRLDSPLDAHGLQQLLQRAYGQMDTAPAAQTAGRRVNRPGTATG